MTDIDPNLTLDAKDLDTKLRISLRRFEKELRQTSEVGVLLADLLDGHFRTHSSIRLLMKKAYEFDSQLGDALSLVREQIERVFIVARFVDDPEDATRRYFVDAWAKQLKIRTIEADETSDLPRFFEFNNLHFPNSHEELRGHLGISEEARDAVIFAAQNPGVALPPNLQGYMPPRFPTPQPNGKGIKNQKAKAGIARWYIEYERMCDFTHVLLNKLMLAKLAGDEHRDPSVKYKIADEHATLGIITSCLSGAYQMAEIWTLGTLSFDCLAALEDLWAMLRRGSLLANALYDMRIADIFPPSAAT
ncbi:MAG TPA: hypothetical protein VHE55_00310 [Fimbriimonadaceae bacterium]|nr:hypothetical protein [Fimbriimonadaceae bacterium]